MNTIKKMGVLLMCAISAMPMMAQQTCEEMQLLTVNENVTTVITASEPVRLVDISTDKVAGDQPINNTIRLKPKEGVEVNKDGDILAIVTIVTERYRTQYALIYTSRLNEAVTDKTIELDERIAYTNPAVSMSTEDMTRYARQIWTSPAKFRDVGVQTIELTPELVLEQTKGFKYGYRNVIVLKKMTFPNDKVLTIELSEKQISGRTIFLNIEYNDVLTADSFSRSILYEE